MEWMALTWNIWKEELKPWGFSFIWVWRFFKILRPGSKIELNFLSLLTWTFDRSSFLGRQESQENKSTLSKWHAMSASRLVSTLRQKASMDWLAISSPISKHRAKRSRQLCMKTKRKKIWEPVTRVLCLDMLLMSMMQNFSILLLTSLPIRFAKKWQLQERMAPSHGSDLTASLRLS